MADEGLIWDLEKLEKQKANLTTQLHNIESRIKKLEADIETTHLNDWKKLKRHI